MSGFDDNPFDNEPTVDNPFADPSVQQMTKKPTNIQQGLDDYNPFADPTSQQRAGTVRGAANPPPQYAPGAGPAVMAPTSQDVSNTLPLAYNAPPPAYNKSSQQVQPPTLTTTELQRRQEELDRKAAELERREQELRRNEVNVRRNNWPPLPDNCCWQPCFYLDINVEIQPEFQRIVTQLYKLWQFHAALLLANVFGSVWINVVEFDISDFFLSIVYSTVIIPLSFLCWFRPGYKAFRDDSSFNFMVFFFIFFFQFVLSLLQGFGFADGYCGLLKSFHYLEQKNTKSVLVGIIILCIALGFLAAAAADLYLLAKIHRIYRSSGASFSKAQAEFAEGFFRNEHVRGAAANVAQAAVRQQFANQSQQPPSNRY